MSFQLAGVQDVATVLAQEYPQGIDVAYEGVGGRLRQAVLQHLTPQGRLLGVGYISSYPHTSGYAQNGGCCKGAATGGVRCLLHSMPVCRGAACVAWPAA